MKNNNQTEPQKRRRLKVVRACRECRRKKTKCDGEKRCSACIKSHTDCQYITSKQVSSDHTLETIGTTTILTSTRHNHQYHQHQQKEQKESSRKQPVSIAVTVHSIEKRLTTIEDQLRYIFQKQYLPPPPPMALSSSSPISSISSSSFSPSSLKNDTLINSHHDSPSPLLLSSTSPLSFQNNQQQQEKDTSLIPALLTLPPLQPPPTSSLYSEKDNLFHKKIPLLQSIFDDN
ncbi:hypothetical protein BJ944DRAFT_183791 [Cunninghamella echinulata]|nr:hypothetical protein BJ944DRAFT_183791 [Cunninghamella echinulata]